MTPYGTERSFKDLRLAKTLVGKGTQVTVFLMADAVACSKSGQKVPQGGKGNASELFFALFVVRFGLFHC